MNPIISVFIVLACCGAGVYFAIRKLRKKGFTKKDSTKEDIYLKEFNEGKILLPIDKRDFENFEEFKEGTKDIKNISSQLDSIDKDFEARKFNIVPRETYGVENGK